MSKLKLIKTSGYALALSFICFNAFAANEKAIIFGDSNSDEGRIYELTDQTYPVAPYHEGRFTNGPVWPEYIYAERENYAYGGAKSDYTNTLENKLGAIVENTGLLGQIDEYLALHADSEIPDDTIFYIFVGANDLTDIIPDLDDNSEQESIIRGIIQNIELAIQRLKAAHVEKIAVIGLPDLATGPLVNELGSVGSKILTAMSDSFNRRLKRLAHEYNLEYIDMDAFATNIMNHPAAYGFSNIDDPCYDEASQTVCENPDEYFFWDTVHTTTRVHKLFAEMLKRLS